MIATNNWAKNPGRLIFKGARVFFLPRDRLLTHFFLDSLFQYTKGQVPKNLAMRI